MKRRNGLPNPCYCAYLLVRAIRGCLCSCCATHSPEARVCCGTMGDERRNLSRCPMAEGRDGDSLFLRPPCVRESRAVFRRPTRSLRRPRVVHGMFREAISRYASPESRFRFLPVIRGKMLVNCPENRNRLFRRAFGL